ncbi:DUF4423 domain-containing protein [Bdellovibrio sp. HCB288]|uniref:DUF4423 domain-containing protein n=1 Tax=Bdellovibrio sp. HCB288 TaxID=3394355 RepID=UPI0039B6C026
MVLQNKVRHARDLLALDYHNKRTKNHRFSKRSYATQLEISSGRLGDLLSGRRTVNAAECERFLKVSGLSAEQKIAFQKFVINEARNFKDRRKKVSTPSGRLLSLEEFEIISDWEYFSFMALAESSVFKSDVAWIAKKLGLTQKRVEEVIGNLHRSGFVTIDLETGSIKNVHQFLATLTDIPSEVIKNASAQHLQRAMEKLFAIDVDAREVTTLTLPIDRGNMKDFKAMIRRWKSELVEFASKQNTNEVYDLNIQFVPVSVLDV